MVAVSILPKGGSEILVEIPITILHPLSVMINLPALQLNIMPSSAYNSLMEISTQQPVVAKTPVPADTDSQTEEETIGKLNKTVPEVEISAASLTEDRQSLHKFARSRNNTMLSNKTRSVFSPTSTLPRGGAGPGPAPRIRALKTAPKRNAPTPPPFPPTLDQFANKNFEPLLNMEAAKEDVPREELKDLDNEIDSLFAFQ